GTNSGTPGLELDGREGKIETSSAAASRAIDRILQARNCIRFFPERSLLGNGLNLVRFVSMPSTVGRGRECSPSNEDRLVSRRIALDVWHLSRWRSRFLSSGCA